MPDTVSSGPQASKPAKQPATQPVTQPASVYTKRSPGAKEVVPMEWKLVGVSSGMPVTLMKCTDRTEAEAQLKRLENERYYENLKIFPIAEEVPLTPTLKKVRRCEIDRAMAAAASAKAAKAKVRSSSTTGTRRGKAGPAAGKRTARGKSETKVTPAKAGTKTATKTKKAAKSAAKRSAKALAAKKPKVTKKAAKSAAASRKHKK